MSVFLGIDRSAFPGLDLMKRLRAEALLDFTGFYLAPAPSHKDDDSWMNQRAALTALGYGFAPIYVGQQQTNVPRSSHIVTVEQGKKDGVNATQLALAAGFPKPSVLYLDIESGPPPEPALLDYYKAWVDTVETQGFKSGLYCSHRSAADFIAKDNRPRVWIFRLAAMGGDFTLPLNRPDPSAVPTFGGAKLLQHAQNATLKLNPTTTIIKPIDLDTALIADPSAP